MKYPFLVGATVLFLGVVGTALAIPPPLPPVRVLKNAQLELVQPIVFIAGTDQMMSGGEVALYSVWDYLRQNPEVSVLRIEGHTDNDGDPANNQLMSERRALTVARYLIERGISCKRLIAVGFGASKPIYDNNTPERKANNRRITFVLAARRGQAIDGQPISGGGKIAGDLCATK